MVVGGDNSHGDMRGEPPAPPVNLEHLHDKPPVNVAGADRPQEKQLEPVHDGGLDYARATATEIANNYILRTGPCSPSEFKVMCGVLDLGVKTGAWTPENYQQIQACLEERASNQQSSVAANGLRSVAATFEQLSKQGRTA